MAKKKRYADGGDTEFAPDQDMSDVSPQDYADAKARAKQSKAIKKERTMAKGGTASSRADGIAERGKTKGTFL